MPRRRTTAETVVTPVETAPNEWLRIRGARENNLKNIDLDLPRNQFVVVTGPSGSGKSSLLYETLFAEGQRQFLESLGTSSRQYISQMQRPDVDLIEGMQPVLCIDQRIAAANPRSTVATITEIHDHLRLLYARLGTAYCPGCGEPIRRQNADEILAGLLQRPVGTKLMLLAPRARGAKGAHRELFDDIRKAGFLRARVDGQTVDIDPPPELNPRQAHTIEAVIDRIIIREQVADRLGESLRTAIQQGEGAVIVCELSPDQSLIKDDAGRDTSPWTETLYSTLHACPACGIGFVELEPRGFSFNSPYGACPTCEGLGKREEFDPTLVMPDLTASLAKGLCRPWRELKGKSLGKQRAALEPFFNAQQLDWNAPYDGWPDPARAEFWRGNGKDFIGLANLLEQELATTLKPERRAELERLRGEIRCADCAGTRLNAAARAVKFCGVTLPEWCARDVSAARQFTVQSLDNMPDADVAGPLLHEILRRLEFLERVGLGYLTLDRAADTLSGGELQRVRLAAGIGSGLTGVCYILDEPSIGLHPHDNERLIAAMRALQEQGNSLLVIEHDEAVMRAADYLVDLGPGAGIHGGEVIAQGTPEVYLAREGSLTADYLSGRRTIPIPTVRRGIDRKRQLTLTGCTANNLRNVDLVLPLGMLVCVTGVSGSGKSTLINGTLARALQRRLSGDGPLPGTYHALRGGEEIQRLLRIDQSPIGRNARSTPATYAGIWDQIRQLFAAVKTAKQLGYRANRFSFNVDGGRCAECQGLGRRKIEMSFLPDIEVLCERCNGARFNAATLAVRYRDLNIAQVLELSIEQAAELFINVPTIAPVLQCLDRVGLGYLRLGQPGNTLSGGEAQRLKLATELGRAGSQPTLFLLDEPTTGLHFEDVRRLLLVLDELVTAGHSVLVIEHQLDVIKCADYVIDMGPGGGTNGGAIVAVGTPEIVAQEANSLTGRHLHTVLPLNPRAGGT